MCIQGNSFNFIGKPVGTNLNMASFEWNFGTNASIPNSTDLIVSNVSFTKSGYIPVTLTGKTGTCIAKYVDSIYIFPIPTVNFTPPNNYLCEGLTVKFKNSSTGIIKNEWDFGDLNATNDISNEFEPVFSYPNPGVYQVRLIGGSKGLCYDTSILTLTVNEVLDVWFSNNDSLCITSNSFNFDGSMVGSSTTTFLWDFGPYASITSSNTLDVNNVVFSVPGNITVSLTGNYENCKDSQTSTLFIYKEPTIDFEITPGLQCAPYVAKFINLSTADSQLSYNWEFGNGISSSNKSPTITYDSVGVYDVSLAIAASKGCVDTLYLKKENFISVHPSPESKFIVNPPITDICHSTIHFFDQSVGATNYFYLFDNQSFSDQANPIFNYTKDGIFYPKQIVTNEFLCTDTSQQEIYIEPFMVYIPNAFTPDGDEFNNEFKTYTYFNSIEWDFQIYDRWGNLLFVSTDPRIGWDGYYKGKMVQDGVYTYKLRYISCESTKDVHELTGHFSLIK